MEYIILTNEKKTNEIIDFNNCEKKIKTSLSSTISNYCEIGYNLKKIKEFEMFKFREYENIFDYSSEVFGLSKTTTQNMMSVVEKFCVNEKLKTEFEEYSFSQLVELISIDEKDFNKFSPILSVKKIRSNKEIIEFEKEKEEILNEKIFVKKMQDYLNAFEDLKKNETKISLNYQRNNYAAYEIEVEKIKLFFKLYFDFDNDFSITFSTYKYKSLFLKIASLVEVPNLILKYIDENKEEIKNDSTLKVLSKEEKQVEKETKKKEKEEFVLKQLKRITCEEKENNVIESSVEEKEVNTIQIIKITDIEKVFLTEIEKKFLEFFKTKNEKAKEIYFEYDNGLKYIINMNQYMEKRIGLKVIFEIMKFDIQEKVLINGIYYKNEYDLIEYLLLSIL